MDNEKRAGGLRGAWKRQSAAQQQAAEKRRLGPALQALKALHSVGTPGSMNAEELERKISLAILPRRWRVFPGSPSL